MRLGANPLPAALLIGALLLGLPVCRATPALGHALCGPPPAAPALVPAPIPGTGPCPAPGRHNRPSAATRAAARAVTAGLGQPLGPQTLITLRDLAAHDSPLAADALIEVLAQGSPCLHATARQVMAGFRHADTLARLVDKGLAHKQPGVRAAVLEALVTGRAEAIDWAAELVAALADPAPRVRAAAVTAAGRARLSAQLETLVELASDPSERVRAAAPAALVRLAGRRSLPLLAGLADDPAWRVRLALTRALVELKTRAGVVLLVDMLQHEKGRVREDITSALVGLTSRNYGQTVSAWRAFLEQAPPDFLAPPDASAGSPGAPRLQTVARYYGIDTLSTRFALVTDLSGSMDWADPGRYQQDPRTRLDTTKIELTHLIGALDPDVRFNLFSFSDDVDSWHRTLVPADPRHRKAALAEVKHYRADGSTNLYAALETVFDLAEASIDAPPRNAEQAPDTVFLLTDGAPSAGLLQDTELLGAYAVERNRSAQLRFHCVSLSPDPQAREFLDKLAQQSGGRSVRPKN